MTPSVAAPGDTNSSDATKRILSWVVPSAPPNALAGFDGPIQGARKRGEGRNGVKKKGKGREKTPPEINFCLRPCMRTLRSRDATDARQGDDDGYSGWQWQLDDIR